MAWFSRFTRFGDMHLVYGQEAKMSCGIASIMMCVFKINKLKPGATAVHVEADIYKKYEKASGAAYQPNKRGTHPTHIITVLNQLTSGTWAWHKVPAADAGKRIIDVVGVTGGVGPILTVNPMIVGIDWDKGGAHWAVIDTVREFAGSKYATVCDPWDANVHVTPASAGSAFTYDANQAGFSVDFGGTHYDYKPGARGKVDTWGMIYRTK